MPVSRISSVSLSLSFLRYIANIRFAQENLCLTSKIVFPHIPQRDTKKIGIKTLMAKNSRHCDGENDDDDDDGGKNYETSH